MKTINLSMKIKIYTLLFFSILTVTAQEKQNDATWNETIDFLQENIHHLNYLREYKSVNAKSEFKLENNILTKSEKITNGYGKNVIIDKTLNFKLQDILRSEFVGPNLVIDAIGHTVTGFENGKSTTQNHMYFDRSTNWNDEMINRIFKAFKHLAFLANEKRENSKF